MATAWYRRYFLIVRATVVDTARTRFRAIDPDVNSTGGWTIPLATPAQPSVVVAYGMNTKVTAGILARYGTDFQDYASQNLCKSFRLDDGSYTVETALAAAWTGGLVFATVAA